MLFGAQLGGGTDIHRVLSYGQGLARATNDTILALISDLFKGGDRQQLLKRAACLANSRVQLIVLLALPTGARRPAITASWSVARGGGAGLRSHARPVS